MGEMTFRLRFKPQCSSLVLQAAVGVYLALAAFAAFNYCSYCRVITPQEVLDELQQRKGKGDHCVVDLKTMGVKDVKKFDLASEEDIIRNNPEVQKGGKWEPSDCRPWQNIAIIVPYRNRLESLYKWLRRIHPMLQTQKVKYRLIISEQAGMGQFNRAKLFNVGYLEAMKLDKFDCLIFHDVDLLPEDDRNLYLCNDHARHLEAGTDDVRYHVKYYNYAGGVLALSVDNFVKINGYPNKYWGWGCEDDDFSARMTGSGLLLTRPPRVIGRYKTVPHPKNVGSISRNDMFLGWRTRWFTDGLNDPKGMNYTIVHVKEYPLYTHVLADVGSPPAPSEIAWDRSNDLSTWRFLQFYYP